MASKPWSVLPVLLVLLMVPCSVRGQALVTRPAVLRGLDALEKRLRAPSAEAQWLTLAPAMGTLSIVEQRAWLERAVRRAGTAPVSHRLRQALKPYRDLQALRQEGTGSGVVPFWWVAMHGDRSGGGLDGAVANQRRLADPREGRDDVWTRLEVMVGSPGLPLWSLGAASRARAFTAAVTVTVSRTRRAILWLGGVGDLVIHLDGQELGRVRDLATPWPDQLKLPVDLIAGSHVLVITMMVPTDASPSLFARWSDATGRPLKDIGHEIPSALPLASDQPPKDGLMWTDAIDFGPDDERHALLRSMARRSLGIPDAGADSVVRWPILESAIVEATKLDVDSQTLALALTHVPRPEDRAGLLDELLGLRRGDPLLVANRAQVALDRDRPFAAQELLQAVPTDLRDDTWRLVASRSARALGRLNQSLKLLDDSRDKGSEIARTERAVVQLEIGRPDRAAQILRRQFDAQPGAAALGASLVEALQASGRAEDALEVLMQIAIRRPDLSTYALEAARLARHLERTEEALSLVNEARQRLWTDPEMLGAVADLYEQLDEVELAAQTWERALHLRPGDTQFRAGWERLQPPRDAALPFETDPHAASQWKVRTPDTAWFTVLSDETHVELRVDGSRTRFEQVILRVHRVPERREDRAVRVWFEPDRDQVRVLTAGLHRGGLWLRNTEREIYEITEEEFGLYYDLRELVVPFDDLLEGDTVAVRYRVDRTHGELGFGWVGVLQGVHPKHRVLVTARAPASIPIRSRLTVPPGGDGPALDIQERRVVEGDSVRLRLAARSLPPVVHEPLGPPLAEVSAVWQISSIATWEEVAASYESLIRSQRVVSAEMRAWVADHVKRSTRDDGTVSRPLLLGAMVHDLIRDIRYVGLEFGVHGVVPYRTDQVWDRRFGDCKDQALLVASLLEVAGLEARMTLVRTGSRGRLSSPLPSLTFFDHAVIYLPDLDLHLDPTARYYGLGTLPAENQGAQALHLGASHGPRSLVDIPMDRPEANHVEGDYTIVVAADGSASVEGTVHLRGLQGAKRRAHLQDQSTREHRVKTLLNQRYSGLSVTGFELHDLERRDQPLGITFTGRTPWLAKRLGTTLQVASPTGFAQFAPRMASLKERRSTLRLGPPASTRSRTRYLPPSGWRLRQVPKGGAEDTEFGSWSVDWTSEPGAAEVEVRLVYGRDRIEPATYPAFRAFLRRLDAHLREPLVWDRASDGGNR